MNCDNHWDTFIAKYLPTVSGLAELHIMRGIFVLVCFCVAISVFGRKGIGPTDQDWGHVDVRPGAHVFWWLHRTTAETERPLIVWLQGGPGGSSTGNGNFLELGPLDLHLNPRNSAWTKNANVLFVDNPVGTGFSYADSLKALTTTNRQIGEDFVVLLRGFYEAVPELQRVPLYIFSQSYGAKMATEIALAIDEAVENGTLHCNLTGIGLGSPWVSPIDQVSTWAPYLLNLGALDQKSYEHIQKYAERTQLAVKQSQWEKAKKLWLKTQLEISRETHGIDFYNVLIKSDLIKWKSISKAHQPWDQEGFQLKKLMNLQVKQALGLNVSWGAQKDEVFKHQGEEFMKPVTHLVETILNSTNIKISVYSGQLDLVVDLPGVIKWVDQLKFDQADQWKKANREPLFCEGVLEGHFKKSGNLAFYWISRAGHNIPADNPAAMQYILQELTDGFST